MTALESWTSSNTSVFAVATGADRGGMYAGLFAPGGKFLQWRVAHGREALANVGYRNSRGPQSVFHYLMSHAIGATPDGNARGKEQLVQWELGNDGQPSKMFGGGLPGLLVDGHLSSQERPNHEGPGGT